MIAGVALCAALVVRLAAMAVFPVFEPSEARYAAISANMARTGDFIVPCFTCNGIYQPFAGKPPLVFQASGLACRWLGVNEFAVRLFPFLSFLALIFLTYAAVRSKRSHEAGMLAAGICATSCAAYATAGFAMTDIPLACSASGALLLYWARPDAGRLEIWRSLAIAALLAVGMLIKGPVALALFALPAIVDAAANRRWRVFADWRAIALALPLFIAICAPWFVLMEIREPGFLKYFFVNENILRFLVHDYGDKYGAGREAFRGVAVVWALVVTLPWSLFLLRKTRYSLRGDFPLLAVCTITFFWCLTSRVPLAYLLPVVPLFASHLAMRDEISHQLWRALPFAAAGVACITIAVLSIALFASPKKMPGADAPKRISDHYFSYEFYNGPWGEGAPQ